MVLKLAKIHVFSSFEINIVPNRSIPPKLENLEVNYAADKCNKGVAVCEFSLITLNVKDGYHN